MNQAAKYFIQRLNFNPKFFNPSMDRYWAKVLSNGKLQKWRVVLPWAYMIRLNSLLFMLICGNENKTKILIYLQIMSSRFKLFKYEFRRQSSWLIRHNLKNSSDGTRWNTGWTKVHKQAFSLYNAEKELSTSQNDVTSLKIENT